MSLIVHLPLNGNLNNYGASDIYAVLSSNPPPIDNNGLIDKTYLLNNSATNHCIILKSPQKSPASTYSTDLYRCFTGGTQPFSICFWVYETDGNGSANAMRAVYFGDYSLAGTIQFNIEKRVNGQFRFYWYPSGSPAGFDWAASSAAAALIPQNEWAHIAVVYDGSSLKYYLNGVLRDTRSGALAARNKTSGDFQIGRDGRTGDTAYQGRINDFRVYDHALSVKEILDLQKKEVVHYTFSEPEVETTTNLLKYDDESPVYGGSTARWTRYGNGVQINPSVSTSDTYWFFRLASGGTTLTADTTYTLSYDVTGLTRDDIKFKFANAYGPHTLHNGHNEHTFTTASSELRLFYDDTETNATQGPYQLTNFQLEQKDHGTPWVVGSRTFESVKDITNNGYDSDTNINLKIVSGNGSGTTALRLGSGIRFEAPALPTSCQTNCTVLLWYKGSNSSGNVIFADATSQTCISFYTNSNLIISSGNPAPKPLFQCQHWKSNDWNHIAVVYGNNTYAVYINGEACGASTLANNYWTCISTKFLMGCRQNSSGYNQWANGQIADFKVYKSQLTAAQIKDEYQTRSQIYKNGLLECAEFLEEASEVILPTKAGVVKSLSIDEGTTQVKLYGGYTLLSYLQTSGSQYINTGTKGSAGLSFNLKVAFLEQTSNYQMNGWNSDAQIGIDSSKYWWNRQRGASPTLNTLNRIYDAKLSIGETTSSLYIDDVLEVTSTLASNYSSKVFCVGATVGGSSIQFYSKERVYRLTVTDSNNNIIADYVPAKKNINNTLGLYDLIGHKFYASTGTLTAGNEIGSISYINTRQLVEQ